MKRGLALVLVVLLLAPTPALAAVKGSPEISLTSADNRVVAGETTGIGVTVVNTGDIDVGSVNPSAEARVTTARGLTLEMDSGEAPISVKTGTVGVGTVPEGAVGPLNFEVVVDEDAKPGTYRVPVEVSYTYTSNIAEQNVLAHDDEEVTETLYVTVVVERAPRFEVVSAENSAPVGGAGQVTLTVENVGSAPASTTSVAVESVNDDLTFVDAARVESFVGDLAPGETANLSFASRVASDAEQRALALHTTVSYEDPDGTPGQEALTTGVTPATTGRFTIVSGETTAAAGGTGTYTVGVRNDGPAAEDVTLTLTSSDPSFTFGDAPTAATTLGDLDSGETREVSVQAAFASGAKARTHSVDAVVSYTTASGREATARPDTFGVVPASEQAFAVEDGQASLRVGSEGTLSGTLVNEGPRPVENAVLVIEPAGSVSVVETEYALGDLAAGDSATFSYDVEVPSSARAGPRQFAYRVRYEDADGETLTSDRLYTRADVGPRRQVFDVETDTTVETGATTELVVTVTNNEDVTLTDISGKLFADDPVSATNDEAFVDELGPGESAEFIFEISAAGSAQPKVYPVSMDFQYEEPDGDTKLSDTYQAPIEVTEKEGGGLLSIEGLPMVAGGLAVGVFGLGAFVLSRRL